MFTWTKDKFCVVLICISAFAVSAGEIPNVDLIRTPDGGIQPQAAVDEQGTVHLIYYKGADRAGDIFYVTRQTGEKEFSKAIRVNSQPGTAMAVGTIRGAQMALGKNGRVHVAWNGHAPKDGNYMDAPMLYTRLNDARNSFEPQRNVITRAGGLDGGGSVAADQRGDVFVMWHAPKPGNTNGEAGRAVFVAKSIDEGKTFAPETLATSKPTGACGCCGMKAFVDKDGDVFALFRAASEKINRNETLLISRDQGESFDVAYSHPWQITTCPMSSAFLAEGQDGILAAGETHGRVFFIGIDPKTGKVSKPVSPETKGKYPVVVENGRGQILLTWAEGTAWAKGGSIAWQIFDRDGKTVGQKGTADGLPTWSLPAAYAARDGSFTVIY
jgi:hypothetical protein